MNTREEIYSMIVYLNRFLLALAMIRITDHRQTLMHRALSRHINTKTLVED